MSDGPGPGGSERPDVFFSDVVGIRTGDPVFGSLPAHAQLGQRVVDGLPAHASAGDAHCHTHLGRQFQRPDAGVLAERAWALVQQRTQPVAPLRIDDLVGRVRPRRFGLQRSEPALVKIVDGVAHRLIIAAHQTGDCGRRLSLGAGQQHLATADGEAF